MAEFDMILGHPTPHARLDSRNITIGEIILSDGYHTCVMVHSPPDGVKLPPVVYMHGIQSHPGWFVRSAEAMAATGRFVFQVTRRGSGLNGAQRGHAKSADQLLDDVQCACEFVMDKTRQAKVHLASVSWGGKLLAAYAATRDTSHLEALTMIAPGIASKIDVGLGTKIGVALSMLTGPLRQFAIPLGDPELFTSNPPMIEFLRDDPVQLHEATAGFLYASRQLDKMLQSAARGSVKVLATLILSKEDRIIDNTATCKIVDTITAGAADIMHLPGDHTLEFEPDCSEFHAALAKAFGPETAGE